MPRLELQIEVDESPGVAADGGLHVMGAVRSVGGHERAFVGWIGLLALLQEAVSTADPGSDRVAADSGSDS